MRFGVAIPQTGPFVDAEVQLRMASEIEAMGYDSIWVSDHVIVPAGEGYTFEVIHEPLALLAWLAGRTTRVTLGISVLILPYRDPVFTAKFLGSADVLSGGRIILGVGAGWLEKEFEALSASFADRGPVTDEYLRVIRNLWETETSSFSGRWKSYQDMRMFPKQHAGRTGTIPIVVGGNLAPSIRRAAELGDGWHPINQSPEQLRASIQQYHAACQRFGRSPGQVVLRHMPAGRVAPEGRAPLTGSVEEQRADVVAYREAGLDELMLSLAARSADELLDVVGHFKSEVASVA
jgi:probable F420-dependent oxidoreductase